MNIRKTLYKIKKTYWNKLTVLCYHRVEDIDADPANITVGIENFLKQIDWLKKSTNIITPAEFENILNGRKSFPKRSILLTFDDGYLSYEKTMSFLKEHSISAIFFISTPKKMFYWDFLSKHLILPKKILNKDYLVFSEILDFLEIKIKIEKSLDEKSIKELEKWKLPSKDFPFERCRAFLAISNWLEFENPYQDKSIFEKISKINKISPKLNFLTSNPDITNYHTIGSHTNNHFNLNLLNTSQLKDEVIENKNELQTKIKKNIYFFAYPFGKREHYDEKSVNLVKKYFKFAFSNVPGQVQRDSNPYELPRFLVRDWNGEDFKYNIEKYIHFNE